jgi:hypothetical protein
VGCSPILGEVVASSGSRAARPVIPRAVAEPTLAATPFASMDPRLRAG